jgi:thiamine-monophosphate kinase
LHFTVPLHLHEKMNQLEGIRLVGHITPPEQGCYLVTRDGQEMQLACTGMESHSADK